LILVYDVSKEIERSTTGNKPPLEWVSYIRRWFIVLLVLGLAAAEPVDAQTIGNPVRTLRKDEWSAGISGDFTSMKLGSGADRGEFSSFRGLSKVAFGLTGRITISGFLGAANLRIKNPAGSVNSDFDGKYRFAWGGQGMIDLARHQLWTVFAGGGVFYSGSNGTFQRQVAGVTEDVDMQFKWTEYSLIQGLRYNHRKYTVYGGIEELTVHREDQEAALARSTYKSGFRLHVLGGVDVNLSRSFCLNLQVKMRNTMTVSIGFAERTIGF
jgi:hypothetical protein